MTKSAPPKNPPWTPEKGNIFQWVLQRTAEQRASLPPSSQEPLTYKLRKI